MAFSTTNRGLVGVLVLTGQQLATAGVTKIDIFPRAM
jgi:hypothetical protein